MFDTLLIGKLHIVGVFYENALRGRQTFVRDLREKVPYVPKRRRRKIVKFLEDLGLVHVSVGKYGGFWMSAADNDIFDKIIQPDIDRFAELLKNSDLDFNSDLYNVLINMWKSLIVSNPFDFTLIPDLTKFELRQENPFDAVLKDEDNIFV